MDAGKSFDVHGARLKNRRLLYREIRPLADVNLFGSRYDGFLDVQVR